MEQSPFDILGISPSAEPEVVRAAYIALAKKYHPDVNPNTSGNDCTAKMAELNWAKNELEQDLEGWRARASGKQIEQRARGRTKEHTTEAPKKARLDFEADSGVWGFLYRTFVPGARPPVPRPRKRHG